MFFCNFTERERTFMTSSLLPGVIGSFRNGVCSYRKEFALQNRKEFASGEQILFGKS